MADRHLGFTGTTQGRSRAPLNAVPLTGTPALGPLLLRGALSSPFKRRPDPDADVPRTRLVLPGVRVAPEGLAAYERVCGFGAGDADLPVTYPHVLGFPLAMRLMSGRDFPLPLPGLVHTSVEIVRVGALPVDAAYEVGVWVEGLTAHRRGVEVAVVTELGMGGEVVWGSRSTYLARGRGGGGGAAPRTPSPVHPPGRLARPGSETCEKPPRDAEEALPVVGEWRLGADVGRRYGGASGDRNPIHLYPLTARLFGFPRAVAHGMWTVARCLAAHGTPDAVEVRARFRAPVLLPGTVAYGADGTGRFELRAGRDGRVHVTGEVSRKAEWS
ncbi:hypothetical protein JK359_06515 [Streptomyces actinomycinicus]|uniref:MaoC-like domain-containing protein n=1 Tax=Streptomyces actinomycinicus TaxID=1695166 RepID=A0A937EET1_9ACTN|nr:MaoC/PaaZ C-terminal domain-containing protein [Streptomyces actinomycinicus]MBL1081633.1 hypothetical protein [Streptomyces actinomycinicus]